MIRDRALKVVLVVVGLLFLASGYFLVMGLWQRNQSEIFSQMMLSLYVTLGVFVLISVPNPAANRSLIGFAAWSSIAHAAVMAIQVIRNMIPRSDVGGVLLFVIIGVALIALTPAKQPAARASAAKA
jgi:small-conductance mechanosensitive channel